MKSSQTQKSLLEQLSVKFPCSPLKYVGQCWCADVGFFVPVEQNFTATFTKLTRTEATILCAYDAEKLALPVVQFSRWKNALWRWNLTFLLHWIISDGRPSITGPRSLNKQPTWPGKGAAVQSAPRSASMGTTWRGLDQSAPCSVSAPSHSPKNGTKLKFQAQVDRNSQFLE